jgi:membrane protease subunit (stomatin/prohibitin family)
MGSFDCEVNDMDRALIKRAIESAKARQYKLEQDLARDISDGHRKKAERQKEVAEVTIQALERMMPKEVARKDRFEDYAECPNCGKCAVDHFGGLYRFCRHCGQRLVWGE